MSKLKKCLYLINLLERKGAMTLKEINDCYEYSSLYEGDEFLPRTFLRYREYIEETFPCYIDFNQRTGKYELHRHQALYGEDDSLYDYLLSAYHIEGMTELALKHRDKIVLTKAPTGVENVQIILKAIDKKRGIECDYHSYYKKINSISLINKSLYIYNNKQNNKSITKKDYDNYFELSKERVKRIYCFLKDKNKLSTNTLSILKRIYIRYAYSELNRCINRKYGTKQLLQRFDEIRKDELFEEILNELKICGNNKTAKLSFGRAMQDCFVNNKKAQAILISRIINFINKYMYWLYLKIAK